MSSGHGRTSYYQPNSGINTYRNGNKSFVASGVNRPTKRKVVVDSASEVAIVNSLDDFPLTDIDGGDTSSGKRGDIEDIELRTSMAQSNASSTTCHVKHEAA